MAYKENVPLDVLLLELLMLYSLHILDKKTLIKNKSDLRKAKKLMTDIWQKTGQITFGFSSQLISVSKNSSGDLVVSDESVSFIKNINEDKLILVYCSPDFIYLNKNNVLKVSRKRSLQD
jgi:hypothetical protein